MPPRLARIARVRPRTRSAGSYDRGPAMSIFHRYVAAPLLEGRALRSLAFLVIGIPLGIAWFVLLVTGWSLGPRAADHAARHPGAPGASASPCAAPRPSSGGSPTGCSTPAWPGRRRPVWTGGPLRSLWCWLTDPACVARAGLPAAAVRRRAAARHPRPRRDRPGPAGAHAPLLLLRDRRPALRRLGRRHLRRGDPARAGRRPPADPLGPARHGAGRAERRSCARGAGDRGAALRAPAAAPGRRPGPAPEPARPGGRSRSTRRSPPRSSWC